VNVISVRPGQEVVETVTRCLKDLEIENGAIVSVIGAVDECCISNMPRRDATTDVLTDYAEPFEMSGTGEVKDGRPHIHCVLGTEGNATLSGHLHWARVETCFVNIYVIPLEPPPS
jgi:uncharacterized protein